MGYSVGLRIFHGAIGKHVVHRATYCPGDKGEGRGDRFDRDRDRGDRGDRFDRFDRDRDHHRDRSNERFERPDRDRHLFRNRLKDVLKTFFFEMHTFHSFGHLSLPRTSAGMMSDLTRKSCCRTRGTSARARAEARRAAPMWTMPWRRCWACFAPSPSRMFCLALWSPHPPTQPTCRQRIPRTAPKRPNEID